MSRNSIIFINEDPTKCYFCELPSPSNPVLTNDMQEHLRNACNGHKYTEIAKKLEINTKQSQNYMSRNNLVFTKVCSVNHSKEIK